MVKDQEYIKKYNIMLVLQVLLQNQPLSRADLVKMTNISSTSMTRIISYLIQNEIVRETDVFSKGVGRHAAKLETLSNSVYTVGISIRVRDLTITIIDFHKNCVAKKNISKDLVPIPFTEIISIAYDEIQNLLEENEIPYEKVVGIGISIPGIVDTRKNIVQFSSQFGWKDLNVVDICENIFHKPIVAENDTKSRMVYQKEIQKFGDEKDITGLFIGQGVAVVAISRGSILRGYENAAGELGHIVLDEEGLQCDCGAKGCLQTKLSTKFLLERAKNYDSSISCVGDISEAAKENVGWAKEIKKDFDKTLLFTLELIHHCYNPEEIIVSGSIMDEFGEFVEECVHKYSKLPIYVRIAQDDLTDSAMGSGFLAFGYLISTYL